MTDYRNDARRELARAKDELASAGDERLKYAALELRMAMESLTYDRALAYKDEFPPAEYQAWQPRKVMALLLEIDAVVLAPGALKAQRLQPRAVLAISPW
jgi:hypothetical protein